MATDPVCGMNVPPGGEKATRDYEGQRYYFCSTGCAEKFSRDPARYAAKGAGAAAVKDDHEHTPADTRTYTCPMHPEVRQIGPEPHEHLRQLANTRRKIGRRDAQPYLSLCV